MLLSQSAMEVASLMNLVHKEIRSEMCLLSRCHESLHLFDLFRLSRSQRPNGLPGLIMLL